MNIVQIEENVKQLIHKTIQDESKKQDFIYELLLAYGYRSQSVGRVRSGERNLAEDKENSVFWKRQLYFKIAKQQDLHGLIDQMKQEKRTESNKIRFLIVTDFKTVLAIDTKTQDTLDVPFDDLVKKFDFFLPWAGMEKAVYQGENPADVKAAEKLAKLFDEIKADNFDEETLNNKENLHHLNVFLSRLLFCYFAEDTEIFKDKQFSDAIGSHTKQDGSDLSDYLKRLFAVLNQSKQQRPKDLPDYLSDFPYVNGGLFKDDIQVPKFKRKSRQILIECGAELDWSDINPDIFGSMFQAVVHTEQRSNMGQHYTSVPNIMKVIEPLFLNDLYEELEKNQDSINKLLQLQQRLGQLKIFDPACGSGNFLIIAYKELRKFEMELLKRIQELELDKTGQISKPFSVLHVSQFYGIEVDNFAQEIAILSLWLAEHQMNTLFKDEFGTSSALLPLRDIGQIVCANSNQIDWCQVCPNDGIGNTYVLGNPPYKGFNKQTANHKIDMAKVFPPNVPFLKLDYVSCWLYKASDYILKCNAKTAFVTTSSIVQGEQVELIWPLIFFKGVEIIFAHRPFYWENNAKDPASVMCVVLGLQKVDPNNKKYIIENGIIKEASNINAYLTNADNIFVHSSTKSLTPRPIMTMGSNAIDGKNLIISSEEKEKFLLENPNAKKFIRRYMGGADFLNNKYRYCLWIDDTNYQEALEYPFIAHKINQCKEYRLSAGRDAKKVADKPYRFCYRTHQDKPAIIVPQTTTERRFYLPVGITNDDTVISAKGFAIYELDMFIFGILSSKMHHVWMETTSGKPAGGGYAYSVKLTYNTFPLPKINQDFKEIVTLKAFEILSIREKYIDKTLADLYHKDEMPEDLLKAHQNLDDLIESLYQKDKFLTDEQRLRVLLNMYKKLVS